MHPNIIFAKFQIHANVIPRRRNEGKERNKHREDVMRCGVIPMQFHFITYGMELYRVSHKKRNAGFSVHCEQKVVNIFTSLYKVSSAEENDT